MRLGLPLLILRAAHSSFAQQSNPPLSSRFEKLGHSCGDDDDIIGAERIRLGDQFEKQLLTYLGEDVEKHYWMACSLSSCCRQKPDRSLESLSLLIREQALLLLRRKTDEGSLYQTVALHVLAAVQSEQLGLHSLAIAHKSEAEWLMSERPILRGGWPAMSKADNQIFDSLPRQPLLSKRKAKKKTAKRSRPGQKST